MTSSLEVIVRPPLVPHDKALRRKCLDKSRKPTPWTDLKGETAPICTPGMVVPESARLVDAQRCGRPTGRAVTDQPISGSPAGPRRRRRFLGEMLREVGIISQAQLDHALALQKKERGSRLGRL